MSNHPNGSCCERFDPGPWDEKTLTWDRKPFVKAHVKSFFHMPLNYGPVIKRSIQAIEAAGACPSPMLALSDETSKWGSDLYVEATKTVPGAEMAELSGTFLAKVFEGPYRDIRKWIETMRLYVDGQGKQIEKLYFYYTTCPKCAKEFGKNYVVILAKV